MPDVAYAIGDRTLFRRLREALPSPALALVGAVGWGVAMSLSAQASLWISVAAETFNYWPLAFLCFIGGALAWPFALWAMRFFSDGRDGQTRFAASLLFLSTATIAMTAFLFAMDYRLFYAQWHSAFMTKLWLNQFIFTSAAAVYQFAVLGLRLYLPVGALFLFLVALWFARKATK